MCHERGLLGARRGHVHEVVGAVGFEEVGHGEADGERVGVGAARRGGKGQRVVALGQDGLDGGTVERDSDVVVGAFGEGVAEHVLDGGRDGDGLSGIEIVVGHADDGGVGQVLFRGDGAGYELFAGVGGQVVERHARLAVLVEEGLGQRHIAGERRGEDEVVVQVGPAEGDGAGGAVVFFTLCVLALADAIAVGTRGRHLSAVDGDGATCAGRTAVVG